MPKYEACSRQVRSCGLQRGVARRWAHFQTYVACCQLEERDQLAFFPLFLRDSAVDWYDTLSERVKNDVKALLTAFRSFFCLSDLDHVMDAESVFTRTQRPSERIRDYVAAM